MSIFSGVVLLLNIYLHLVDSYGKLVSIPVPWILLVWDIPQEYLRILGPSNRRVSTSIAGVYRSSK